jgi:hypothetical protein
MFSLAAILFFSVTGITLNHPDWFFEGAESRLEAEGQLNREWLNPKIPVPSPSATDLQGELNHVAKLEVVEHLRKVHRVRGALTEFKADDRECVVMFKGPGYTADAIIDRATGHYSLAQSFHGFIAIVNDLHKGRDTGRAWSVIIDLAAVLMMIVSLTGLGLLFYLKLRRRQGLVLVAIGTVVVVVVYLVGVH